MSSLSIIADDLAVSPPSILGRGPAYPLRLNAGGTDLETSVEEENVKDSILAIIETRVGERPHRVRRGVPLGTHLTGSLFEAAEDVASLARYEIPRVLDVWEPRIFNITVDASVQQNATGLVVVMINIQFRYRSTNRADNFVYPYLLQKSEVGA